MKFSKRKKQITLVAALVIITTILHYLTAQHQTYYHIFYRSLYFLPLILAGTWFGLRGALGTSLTISFLYLPHILMHWHGHSPEDFGNLIEILIFNAIAAVLGVLSDREKAEQERLRESENLAALGQGVSSISHDMKIPLIAIAGFAYQVCKKLDQHDPCYPKLEIILRETRRLETMVKDILDFAKPLKLEITLGDINRVIEDSIAVLEEMARQAQVTLVMELSPELPAKVKFDPLRMEQVVLNLITNAIQSSLKGETVIIHSFLGGDQALFSVEDHGEGIPADKMQRLFEPFFTTKEKGTGLGLAIVKKIVSAHHGHLEAINNPQRGATFKVFLPLD